MSKSGDRLWGGEGVDRKVYWVDVEVYGGWEGGLGRPEIRFVCPVAD